MSSTLNILAHHPESVDPTLVEWLKHKIDEVLGFEPATIVTLIGIVIVLFPIGLLGFMWWQRRKALRPAD